MAGTKSEPISGITNSVRGLWNTYRKYSKGINTLMAFMSFLIAILAYFSPGLLDAIGSGFVLIWTSDATHTLLLIGVLIAIMTSTPEVDDEKTRTDGGNEQGPEQLAWAFLIGLGAAMLASNYGNEWVLPALLGGMAAFLFLSDN